MTSTSVGRAGATRVVRSLEPLLIVAAVLVVWEALVRTEVMSPSLLPAPSAVLTALVGDLGSSDLWSGLRVSLIAWAVGLATIVLIGVPMGVLLGGSSTAYAAVRPTMEFVRTVPSIAAIPILLFVFGVGFPLTVVLVVISGFWPLLIGTMNGVHEVDPVARDTARAYGVGRLRMTWSVVLPSALPGIVTGLRISAVISLLVAVAASLIVGGDGLGERIDAAQRTGQVELMYARIVVASLLGLGVTYLLVALERRVLRWHPSQWKRA